MVVPANPAREAYYRLLVECLALQSWLATTAAGRLWLARYRLGRCDFIFSRDGVWSVRGRSHSPRQLRDSAE